MNEPTLTDTEALIEVIESGWEDEPTEAEQELAATVARNILASDWLAARVAEAVDRENAAWAAKVADAWGEGVDFCEEIAGVGYNPVGTNDANPYRGLLSADDTEAKP